MQDPAQIFMVVQYRVDRADHHRGRTYLLFLPVEQLHVLPDVNREVRLLFGVQTDQLYAFVDV